MAGGRDIWETFGERVLYSAKVWEDADAEGGSAKRGNEAMREEGAGVTVNRSLSLVSPLIVR